MPENDSWVRPEDIPLDLNILRSHLNDGDSPDVPGDYGLRVYTIDSLNTNFARPCFALAEGDAPDMEDVTGVLEETLHLLDDAGATPDDVYRIMGLVQRDDLDPDVLESGEYTDIDLGYCIDGNIASYEAVPEGVADIGRRIPHGEVRRCLEALDEGATLRDAVASAAPARPDLAGTASACREAAQHLAEHPSLDETAREMRDAADALGGGSGPDGTTGR